MRVYAVGISEPPGAGPQLSQGAAFSFHWTSTLCLVGSDQGQRAEGLSCQPPSCTPLVSMGTKHNLMSHFTGMAHHGDVPIESFKRSQSKKRTTSVVGVVAQCQRGVPMHSVQLIVLPGTGEADAFALPLPACGVPWHPDPAHCTWGWPGQARGSTSSKHLHVAIAQKPPGNKFLKKDYTFWQPTFWCCTSPAALCFHLLCAACDVGFHITLVHSVL